MAPQGDKPENPTVKPPEASTAGKFYESAYKPFESKFNEVPNKDKPSTMPEQMKNGWQSGDANANEAFNGLKGDFKAFDTAEAKVREAQDKGLFKETTDATTGAVTRKYGAPLEGYSHTFNKDGSTELKTPTESIKFNGDTATVTGADGKPRELTKEETAKKVAELNKAFEGAKGDFTVDGQPGKGTWKVDAVTGNTTVDNVPGVNGGKMTVNHANTKDDVKYHAEAAGKDGKPGYSTEVTGDNKSGYRFVDYDDSKGQPDVKTKEGKTIEGFVAQRADERSDAPKPPLTLVSDKPAGDGSVTKIGVDGVAETKYEPGRKDGKLSERIYPPNHESGMESSVQFDPKQNPDHLTEQLKAKDGRSSTTRATVDGGTEVTDTGPGGIPQRVIKNGSDGKQQWSRLTDANGVVTSKYPNGETSVVTPGKPPTVKLFAAGEPPKEADAKRLEEFLKTQPPLATEKLSDTRTRETRMDGTTVTTDTKTGITKTEAPGATKYEWDATKKPSPSPADIAEITGLKPADPKGDKSDRLAGIKSPITEYKGGVIDVNYDTNTPNVLKDGTVDGTKSAARIRRDVDGNVVEENRLGATKEGRKFSEYTDQSGARTRTFEPKPGQSTPEQDVYNSKGEKIQDRKVDGGKITTTDYEGGKPKRTEEIDSVAKTWKRTEDGKVTGEGKLLSDATTGRRIYMDGEGKTVKGMTVPPGTARGGDNYSFDRDPATGDLKGMKVETQPHGDKPGQKANLVKEGNVWKVVPNGDVPGFPAANDPKERNADGSLKGQFSTNDKGELVYESGDKMTKQVLRGDGSRDTYDMREYSRIKEGPDGVAGPKKYWDGYGSKANPEDGWREGKATKDANGNITVEFTTPMANHPSRTVRNGDGNNDSFSVEFPNGTGFKVGNWSEGKMIRSDKGKPDTTLYNTGTVGNDGNVQWAKGTPDATTGRIKFDDPRVQSGELPVDAKIDKGKVTATYADGTEVDSDLEGKTTSVRPGHAGSKALNRTYGSRGDLKGFNQGTTTGTLDRTDPLTGKSDWTINSGGKDYKIEGATVTEKPGGKFEIVGKDGTKYESNGRLSTKEGGKDVVYDARGQKWTKSADAKPGDSTKTPPTPGTPPTWETGNPPKKFSGELKMFDNGNVGVQTSNERTETVNGDGSVSRIDNNGFERERVNADGTYQKRGEQGELTEFKSKDGTVTTLDYDRDPTSKKLTGGVKEVKTVDKDNKVVRVEKRDPANPTKLRVESGTPPTLGNEVTYDRMGTRSEIKGTPTDNTTTVTDVHGQTRNIKTVGGKRTEITGPQAGTTGDTTLKLTYGDASADPTSITDGKNEYVRAGKNVFKLKGQEASKDAPTFTLDRDGTLKSASDNIGIDPAFAMQLDQARPRDTAKPSDAPATTTDQQWAAADKILMDKYKDAGIKPGTVAELRNLAQAAGIPADKVTPGTIDTILQASKESGMLPGMDPATLKKMATDLAPVMKPDSESRKTVMAALAVGNLDAVKAALPPSVQPLINEKFVAAIKKAFLQPASPAPK